MNVTTFGCGCAVCRDSQGAIVWIQPCARHANLFQDLLVQLYHGIEATQYGESVHKILSDAGKGYQEWHT